jgi:mRNA-degrading endonuclease YafQ of YafQ-DinJ toxin-antitoxin module
MFSGRTWQTLHLLGIPYLLSLILLGGSARAQDSSTGALRGTVTDAQGAAVSSADVLAVRVETGIRYHVLTDVQGGFTVDLLPPGEYIARAEAAGMSPQDSPRVRVEVGAATELTFKLAVAGAKETLTVSGAPPLVDTQPSSISSLVDERAIADLPLNGRRFTDLSLLAPGVTTDPRGLTSASNGDLAFGGIRGYQSSYLVDGADNNNGFFAQARGRYRAPYQFSNEVVQEFRVSSNTYGAELGRAGGAVVNVVTKSGSNHWHGTGFYFLRDSRMGASPAFVGFKPSDQQHQFGGTLGGPLKRNKAFFFAGYDQHIFNVPAVVEFADGNTVVIPKKGAEPLHHGDYEDSDKDLVFAAAAQLSAMGGTFPAKMRGNSGFVKLDYSLNPRQFLTARVNTSRYYGMNNVFFDPASPITNFALSSNGEEDVKTESASLSLLSGLTPKLTSHLRAQFSRDLQQSFANSTDVRTRIYNVIEAFGQSSILPRQTREHRLHLVETLSLTGGRHDWKFGGDAMLTWDYNYFPSLYGGEYLYDDISVNPYTFEPEHGGMQIPPLRAWAHGVPRYYLQNFGNPVAHPNSNDYSAFLQDTVRLTSRLAVSLGVRYDLQTFNSRDLVNNPLWPASGKMPADKNNFSPRVGVAYSIGSRRPLVVRGGFGIFYTRLPQIYESAVINNDGLTGTFLFLDNADTTQHQIFPTYPNAMVTCSPGPVTCVAPAALKPYLTSDVSAFPPGFTTPKVQQGSLSMEREIADRFAVGASYLYVHGENLIRARDVNLPAPTEYSYPIYDASGDNFQNSYYTVDSFSTWQMTHSLSCPYPPCINAVDRPLPQLGAINQFESAASSIYHGLTVSVRRRMTHGLYFRLAYTWAHAIDDGQDALVAGRPVTVQNSYSTSRERGPSVTDQRNRLSVSWIAEPRPFGRGQDFLGKMFNDWKLAGVLTFGSGRPTEARVSGDPNRDDNSSNDRLPGFGRNAFLGPDYATMDLRLTRKIRLGERYRLELTGESFNVFNRSNRRLDLSGDGFQNAAGQFVPFDRRVGGGVYPAYYQQPTNFMRATSGYAPRQVQVALRLAF